MIIMNRVLFCYLLIFISMQGYLHADNDIYKKLSSELLYEVVTNSHKKDSQKIVAILLAYRKGINWDNQTIVSVKKYILKVLVNPELSNKSKENLTKIIEQCKLNFKDKEIDNIEKIIFNTNMSPWTVRMGFKILYCNFYYTEEKRNEFLQFLLYSKSKIENSEYIATLSLLLDEDSFRTYELTDNDKEELSSLSYSDRIFKIIELTPFSFKSIKITGLESLSFIKLWSTSEKIFLTVLCEDNDLIYKKWCSAIIYLHLLKQNYFREEGGVFFNFMIDLLKKHRKNPKVLLPLLHILGGNSLSIVFFRDQIPLLDELNRRKDLGGVEIVQFIINELTCNGLKDINLFVRDKTQIEKRLYRILNSGTYRRDSSSGSSHYTPFSLLLYMGLIYDDLQFPETYEASLDSIKSGTFTRNDLKCMEILLVQNNQKYHKEMKKFIAWGFANIDKYHQMFSFFYSGLASFWINDKDVRQHLIKRVIAPNLSFEEGKRLFTTLSNVNNEKKEIAILLIKAYFRIRSTIVSDKKQLEILSNSLTGSIERLTGNNIDLNHNLKVIIKTIDAMPDDEISLKKTIDLQNKKPADVSP